MSLNIPGLKTMMIDNNLILISSTLALCILIFIRSIVLRKRAVDQSQLLTVQSQDLEELREKLNQQETIKNREESFLTNLKQAEVTTELQKPRSSFTHDRHNQRPPERYRYAQSMFQSGIQNEEIASALSMSGTEISQLLKLAKIRCEAEKAGNTTEMVPAS